MLPTAGVKLGLYRVDGHAERRGERCHHRRAGGADTSVVAVAGGVRDATAIAELDVGEPDQEPQPRQPRHRFGWPSGGAPVSRSWRAARTNARNGRSVEALVVPRLTIELYRRSRRRATSAWVFSAGTVVCARRPAPDDQPDVRAGDRQLHAASDLLSTEDEGALHGGHQHAVTGPALELRGRLVKLDEQVVVARQRQRVEVWQ